MFHLATHPHAYAPRRIELSLYIRGMDLNSAKEMLHVLLSGLIGALIGGFLPLAVQWLSPDKVHKIEVYKPIEIKKNESLGRQENQIHDKLPSKTDTLIAKTISVTLKKK